MNCLDRLVFRFLHLRFLVLRLGWLHCSQRTRCAHYPPPPSSNASAEAAIGSEVSIEDFPINWLHSVEEWQQMVGIMSWEKLFCDIRAVPKRYA